MIHKQKQIVEVIDWTGIFIIVFAYAGGVFGGLDVTSPLYLVLNIVGSLAIAYGSWKKKDIQPVVLNWIWIAIAVFGIIRFYA